MHMTGYNLNDYRISTDRSELDLGVIHHYLSEESYWAMGIPFVTLKKAIDHSLNFGVYHQNKQIGFARLVTDYATFAYLCDVFILEEHRGKGISKWLMKIINEHPELQGFRRWVLLTRDAHGLYAQHNWSAIKTPDRYMERHFPDVYKKS
jgi:GNAT superfamily N-acetyltransferase